MRIKKIRINNFRSIQDLGGIVLEDGVTVLAGKNESGKTAILEAIEDLDKAKKIRPEAIPLQDRTLIPTIRTTVWMEESEIKQILEKLDIQAEASKIKELEIIKTFPNVYTLSKQSNALVNRVLALEPHNFKAKIKGYLAKLSKACQENAGLGGVLPEDQLVEQAEVFVGKISEFKKQVEPTLTKIADDKKRNEFVTSLSELIELAKVVKGKEDMAAKFVNELTVFFPNFIYFDSFNNILPFEIEINKAKENNAVKNFAQVADIDLDYLLNQDRSRQERMNYLSKKSTIISGKFLGFWNQDKVELQAKLDGQNLVFGFVEEGRSEAFSMDQRSKGFQWFLSFYIQLQLFYKKEAQNYLLVDEPGSYLHAKAQQDVLTILEEISQKSPVVFTTHSPYLLEANKLSRVRLVTKSKESGTAVEMDLYRATDTESLTPILTAIGLEVSSGIANADRQNNVVVEGPSDWYYFSAFKTILGVTDINIIYGGGSGNMAKVGTILHGWGCKVLYLLDNDQGKKDGERNLTKKWLVEKAKILPIAKADRVRIEDLFDKKDFETFVLKETMSKSKVSNSDYLQKLKKEKRLLAKSFWSEVAKNRVKLSDVTMDNFKGIFKMLGEGFKQ